MNSGRGAIEALGRAREHLHEAVVGLDNAERYTLWDTNPPMPEHDSEANIKAAISAIDNARAELERTLVLRAAFLRKLDDN
ncbi:MAG: hypothetical protein QOH16_3900 [Gaiellaceae bacterium]|nr:hypothetical protein [Gaiellaceae bacterium]